MTGHTDGDQPIFHRLIQPGTCDSDRGGVGRHPLATSLVQTTRQEMRLVPRMLQAIEILQLSSLDLDGFLNQAAAENEALRVAPPEGRRLPSRARSSADSDRHQAWLENQPAAGGGLVESLEAELGMLDLSAELEPWVRLVIECLDERGFLSLRDEAIFALARERGLGADPARLGRAIGVVQGLEPRGVGARDAVEALLLQLDPREPDYGLLCSLLEGFLVEIAGNRLDSVAAALDIDRAHLERLIARLSQLEPVPAAEDAAAGSPPVHPELVVERKGERFEVRIDRSGLPAVSIEPAVERRARDRAVSPDVRRYLRGQLERARWLIDAVEQRRGTLLRIATVIFERQRRFLAGGPKDLRPLSRSAVAEELGLHLSTVSRAVSSKHVQTPWGVFALSTFFPSPAKGSPDEPRDNAREAVRSIVAGEARSAPLSDDEIAVRLRALGFRVARRTVAKYRSELGIESSYRRRVTDRRGTDRRIRDRRAG